MFKKNHLLSNDEAIYGIDTIKEGQRVAFLANIKTATIVDEDLIERTVLSLYMMEPNGQTFHAYLRQSPYFYITCKDDLLKDMMVFLERKFEKKLSSVELVEKVDLDDINYLSGKYKRYIRLNFRTIADLLNVRAIIKGRLDQKSNKSEEQTFEDIFESKAHRPDDLLDSITDIREYDVNYHIRVCIDWNIRCSHWYTVTFKDNYIHTIEQNLDKAIKPDLRVLAFDIETTKQEMKFPDARIDEIMMISYVIDGEGFLITNRTIVSKDIEDFEYTPRPEYEGKVTVYNEPNETSVLEKFFAHIREVKPMVIVTYNGDFFDWPFVEARAKVHNINMHQMIGISCFNEQYFGKYVVHMDCMHWVNRDSYLPQGSRGLKSVTKYKLGYNPIELDPEEMLPLARSDPQLLSQYSVSDSIATYYLYKKHIHDFIYALCTIIPTMPDDVLRAGSGTLCENLLMAAAYERNIIFPNKKKEEFEKFYKGHLLNTETYIGGKVECINSGVYRDDVPTKFRLEPQAYHELTRDIEKIMDFAIETELQINKADIVNYDEVKENAIKSLQELSEVPDIYDCKPLIYHLDVAAMYPNIILTNRLQPTAIVDEKKCSGCIFNRPGNNCMRNLNWEWKGEYFPITKSEYEDMKVRIEYEHQGKGENGKGFYEYPEIEQFNLIKKKARERSQKFYKQIYVSKIEMKENTVCMRANSFYVDTIRDFRDRRYDYKNLVKVWKTHMAEYEAQENTVLAIEARDKSIMYESLQLAHKVILNSFYGYVMRRGARWYSMEMAAMVTHIGSNIIMDAKKLIDKIGKPLELDTDGIWCLLPKGFPEKFTFTTNTGKKFKIDFPGSMLNLLIYDKYANPQYQTLKDPKSLTYETRKEMSVFFEVDGPYKAMIIPAAREEGKTLKKRYVVYNFNGSIAEIKGFELKRRGELKIIKIFQEDLFNHFLDGATLDECYQACGAIADRWLDILFKKGEGIEDEELFEYIAESKTMSKALEEYEKQRGVAITAVKRMNEFLTTDTGVNAGKINCHFIISQHPQGAPVSERVIPIQIFQKEESIRRRFLNKWLKGNAQLVDTDVRKILDWQYYIDRLGACIQKILTIPAALQKCRNPVPRVPYPDWLHKKVRDYDLKFEQKKVSSFFTKPADKKAIADDIMDLEDMMKEPSQKGPKASVAKQSANKLFINFNRSSQTQEVEERRESLTSSQAAQRRSLEGLQPYSNNEPEVTYNMDEDFDGWLKCQKKLWRARRKGERNQDSRKSGPRNAIGNMFRSHEEHVLVSTWHILQVCETETPGIYKVWVYLENSQLIAVKVNINRVFYVNSLVKSESEDFKSVRKRLPRNKKQFYLYERTINEKEFLENFRSFEGFLTNPDYEGVYETKIPLDFRFISELGAIMKFKRNKTKSYSGYNSYLFDMEELEPEFNYGKEYLSDFNLPVIVISQIVMNGKSIWAVFNHNLNEYNFLIVDKNKLTQPYKQIIKETLREGMENPEEVVLKISVDAYAKDENALAHIDRLLQQLKERSRSTPYIVVLQTQYKIQRVMQLGLKSVQTAFPTLHLPAVDCADIQFNSLDWIQKGLKRLCYQYLHTNDLLEEVLGLCRYANIPFCNLAHDKLNFATDVIYARILKKGNCISWYSPNGVPETGGGKIDDARDLIQTDFIPSEFVQPNLYLDYCAEFEIESLAQNAIRASDKLRDIESENSTVVSFNTNNEEDKFKEGQKIGDERRMGDELDETVVSRAAFGIVKSMADYCSKDAINLSNIFADRILANLHRWICDEESKFYDPILHKMLNILMKRFYRYLLQKLKSLGARIVYASQSKIIIGTGKYSFIEAENYSTFVLRTLVSYPLFQQLNLRPQKCFKILLIKDNLNYGGILAIDEEQEESSNKYDLHWNVSEYLPNIMIQKLYAILSQYLRAIYRYMDKIFQEDITEKGAQLDEFKEKIANFSKKYIHDHLSYDMFELIPNFVKHFKYYQMKTEELQQKKQQEERKKQAKHVMESYENEDALSHNGEDYSYEEEEGEDDEAENEVQEEDLQDWEFPPTLGRIPEFKNPVLELIKFLCHILNFDETIQEEVIMLKRNCLRLLGISDFSEESKYVEPCRKIKLTDIVCKNCSNVIEIDVFRDRIFKEKDFRCEVCEMKFDSRRLETKIIKLLKQYVIFYQIQDLYCGKCKMAKSELLGSMCRCSGKYTIREDNPANEFKMDQKQLISSFEELAVHCGFSLLQDYLLELKFENNMRI